MLLREAHGWTFVLCDPLVSSDTLSAPGTPAWDPAMGRGEEGSGGWSLHNSGPCQIEASVGPQWKHRISYWSLLPSWNLGSFCCTKELWFCKIYFFLPLDELNSGSKHVNVKPPQGPPSSLVLADTQNLIKQFGPSLLQFKASMCCVYAS